MTAKVQPLHPLVAEHQAYFTTRGIKPAYAKRMGVHSIANAIVFPYFDLAGKALPGYWRKRLMPAPSGRKFIQPQGSENHLYFAPLPDPRKSWQDVADDPTVDLYSCEGESKAAAVSAAGPEPAYAKGGCWNWRQGGKPIPDFDLINFKGRKVRIVTDSDAHTNLHVQIATIGEYAELRRRGAIPLIIVVPDLGDGKTGADDFIAAKGAKAFQALPALPLEDPAFAGWGLAKEPNATDTGNAARFVLQHGDRVRYVHEWETWLLWDGVRWRRDDTEEIWERARETVRNLYREAHECTDHDRRAMLAKWAVESEGATRTEKMLRVARTDRHVAISAAELDAHPHLLTVCNGVLDLKNGELLGARQEWLLTKQVPVAYNAKATCPRFRRFVLDVMRGDQAMVGYLQRVLGYLLTGDTREQCFFIWHGIGANGKSTLLKVIATLLGDFARATRMETWVAQKRGAGGPSEDIARLHGARMVSAVEAEEEQRLAESMIKELTGQDRVSARQLYERSFEYTPQFKLVIVCNHKPVMRGDDSAVWRRVRLVPFERVFQAEEQNRELVEELTAELPGILNWALEGCLQWQKRGLAEPKKITQATSDYRTFSDVLQVFLDECCERDPKASETFRAVYRTYKGWCKENGHQVTSSTTFARRLQDRGMEKTKRGGERYYKGLRLRDTPAIRSYQGLGT